MVVLYADIRFLVRQTLCHVLLVLCIVGESVVHPIAGIVVSQHFVDGILAHDSSITVVDIIVKHSHHVQRGVVLLEELIVGDGFRDVFCGEHGMELAVFAQFLSALHDVIGHCYMVFVTLIDVLG